MPASDKQESRYPVPASSRQMPYETRLEERRSVFVTHTAHCSNAREAREFVAAMRERYPDATHHCWAFVAGSPGSNASVGFSDDGEPHGTAGRPILNVLLHCGAGNLVTVVSRWFGGIKLGKGGLARAYQEAAQENVKNMPLTMLVVRRRFRARLDYSFLESFHRLLLSAEAEVEKEDYGENATLLFTLPEDRVEETAWRLREMSGGRASLEIVADEEGNWPL